MVDKEKEIWSKGFDCGVVYAVGLLWQTGHQDGSKTLWDESGFTEKELDGCEPYDVKFVREMIKNNS